MSKTPHFLIPYKPDWKSDEVMNPRWTDYYESKRAIGHLFRAITLKESTMELSFDPGTSTLKDSKPDPQTPVDIITLTLSPIVENHTGHYPQDGIGAKLSVLFSNYCLQLKYICLTHTLSHDPDIKLREEEIVVGTILAKCNQARWRKDRIEEMRINVGQLVGLVSAEFKGSNALESVSLAWAAWKYARAQSPEFGHQSFGLIALERLFRALEDL